MSIEVKIPAVGESIESGIVSVWHKKSRTRLNAADPLFTLETEKVSTEITAEKNGVLQTMVAEGAEVKIGEVVATIEEAASSAKPSAPKSEPSAEKSDGQKPAPSAQSSDARS